MSEQNESYVSGFRMRICQRHYRTIRALSIFSVFYIGVGVYMTTQQERFIYHPPKMMADCEAVLQVERTIINGTRLYVYEHSERMVVLYHGNAGTVCDRAHYAEIFREAGWGYVLVGYSGFGDGTGYSNHEMIRADVHNVIQFLDEKNPDQVYVVGESIGAGVASYHVSVRSPNALFLITPFDTLRNVAQHHYWYFPVNIFLREAYDNVQRLHSYGGPVKILHGTHDEIVPMSLAQSLYNSLSTSNKQFVVIEEANHNNIWWYEQSVDALREFLSQ